MKGIEILFENDECLVLDKPAGLPVQGGAGVKVSLDTILARDGGGPLLVHRLDRETSGVILLAKNRDAAARFSAIFAGKGGPSGGGGSPLRGSPQKEGSPRKGPFLKQYLAVCAGFPSAGEGRIEADLEPGRRAETSWLRLGGGPLPEYPEARTPGGAAPPGVRAGRYSVLRLEPGTGRFHQIRRHLAGRGLPVLGDDRHGDFRLNRALRKSRGLRRLLLHAARLAIGAELLGYDLDVTAPLPDRFAEWTAGILPPGGPETRA